MSDQSERNNIAAHVDDGNGVLFNYFSFICSPNNTFISPHNCG